MSWSVGYFKWLGQIFTLNIQQSKSKKQHKNCIIETNTWDIEKLGTNLCVSMHVITNSNKDMLIHYFECMSTMISKMERQIIYRKYAQNNSQYVAQSMRRLYEVHKHIELNIYITLTKIWIKTQM